MYKIYLLQIAMTTKTTNYMKIMYPDFLNQLTLERA